MRRVGDRRTAIETYQDGSFPDGAAVLGNKLPVHKPSCLPTGGGGGPGGPTVGLFRVRNLGDEHIGGQRVEANFAAGAFIGYDVVDQTITPIAKPWDLRKSSYFNKTIYGINYSFTTLDPGKLTNTLESNRHRIATRTSTIELHEISARYLEYSAANGYFGDIIFAFEGLQSTGVMIDGTELTKMDMNMAGRAWSEIWVSFIQ